MTNPPSVVVVVGGTHYFDIFRFYGNSVGALCRQLGSNRIKQLYILAFELSRRFCMRERYLEGKRAQEEGGR